VHECGVFAGSRFNDLKPPGVAADAGPQSDHSLNHSYLKESIGSAFAARCAGI
jgi:hypothetical protein